MNSLQERFIGEKVAVINRNFCVKENFLKKILVTGGTTFVSKYVAEDFVNVYDEIEQRKYFCFYNYE